MTDKTQNFLKKLKESGNWNDDYDYSKVNFISYNQKVIIVDNNFNTEHLISPNNILNRGVKCNAKNLKNGILPFNEAKIIIHSLGIKNKEEWEDYSKIKRPFNIPSNPKRVYENSGWISWGDWFGLKEGWDGKFLNYDDAKSKVSILKINSVKEWRKIRLNNIKLVDIPISPDKYYINSGWISWGDFLNNENRREDWLSYDDAKKIIHTLNLTSEKEWINYCKSGNKPKNIPKAPSQVYKGNGWVSMGEWLGTGRIAEYLKVYKTFEDTKILTQKLQLKSRIEWLKWWEINIPNDIPKNPDMSYKNKGWISWSDFLGTDKLTNYEKNKIFLLYEESREYVRKLFLGSISEWKIYIKNNDLPNYIPSYPDKTYKNNGWISWGDFLGNGRIALKDLEFISFEEAKNFAINLNLSSQKEWFDYCKNKELPKNIPIAVNNKYKDSGWVSWGDFLGTDRVATRSLVYVSFDEAKKYLKQFNLTSQPEYFAFWKNEKTVSLPRNPDRTYSEFFNGWADFLGYLGNGNTWNKVALITYLEQIQDYLHVCTIPQLITIIESNGLFRFINNEKIKKLQDTKPNSQERKAIVDEIKKEVTCQETEELEVVNDVTKDITDTEVSDIINTTSEKTDDCSDNTEVREKELKSLDNTIITSSLDDERVKFLVSDLINNLWYDVLNHKLDVSKIKTLEFETDLPEIIREKFITEYEMVNNLPLPKGWTYQYEPLLMQKLITHRLAEHRRYGNWSGVGAGKTIGAILAGLHVGAKNTLIITFNSTIGEEDKRGWSKEIRDSFKDSKIFTKINKHVTFDNNENNYLILNYETFQQKGSANYVIDLLERNKFDYIILDEVQSVKQTSNDESKRREVIFGLVGKVRELNPDYYLLAMSATPVINNLTEAKSLVELIEFSQLDDVNTRPNVPNCIELFRRLTNCGIRHKNTEDNILKNNEYTLVDVDGDILFDEAELVRSDDFLLKDKLVLDVKLEAIRPYINSSKGKTVIYTYYVDGIEDYVYQYLTNLGYKVGVYTGSSSKFSRESTLSEFIYGKYDVLLGSKPISTGVDGLQKISDRIIILSLPWTNAELVQLVGRVNRKGSNFKEEGVDVIIPLVTINGGNRSFRWDLHKYRTVTYKATIANAAVDGIIPDKLMPSKEKFINDANDNLPEWIERLKNGDVLTVNRKELEVKLFPDIDDEEVRRNMINSELSEFNRMGKTTKSSTMNKKFNDDPESWHRYHRLRRESMKDWGEIPYQVIAKNILCETDEVIDFGCGDNQFKLEIPNNKVTSVDHVACDESVIACDMCDLSNYVANESHDVAVFSLSLWGTNYKDYLNEAYRVLRRKGFVYIAEPSKHYETVEEQNNLKQLLTDCGFKIVGNIDVREKFTYITGIKI